MPDVQRGDQFGAALHADLAEHGLEVVLDRERRDAERRSDLLGAAPLGGERGDLPFARGKPGLRLGLFDITVQAGRTDWADPAQVTELGERWHGLLTLLRAHGDHEDQHILRLLDARDPLATEPTSERFMAGMSPQVQALSIEYTLPALDGPTRTALEARLKAAAAVSA